MSFDSSTYMKTVIYSSLALIGLSACQPMRTVQKFGGPSHEVTDHTDEFNKKVTGSYKGQNVRFEFDGKGSGTEETFRRFNKGEAQYECWYHTPFSELKFVTTRKIADDSKTHTLSYKALSYSVSKATSVSPPKPESPDVKKVCEEALAKERERFKGYTVTQWNLVKFDENLIQINPEWSGLQRASDLQGSFIVKVGQTVDVAKALRERITGSFEYIIEYNGKPAPQLTYSLDEKTSVLTVTGETNLGINECLGKINLQALVKSVAINDDQKILIELDEKQKSFEFVSTAGGDLCPTPEEIAKTAVIEIVDFEKVADPKKGTDRIKISIGKLGPYFFQRK